MPGLLFGGGMRISAFTVHEPPYDTGGTGRIERAENLLFVRDGFSWRAALFSPFYLLVKREWYALAAYLAVALVLGLVLNAIGAQADWIVWTFVILNVVAGFEASELKRWSLGRAGWQEIGSVSGRSREEAERRFFEAWMPTLSGTPSHSDVASRRSAEPPDRDIEMRMQAALKGLSQRLRERFAIKT